MFESYIAAFQRLQCMFAHFVSKGPEAGARASSAKIPQRQESGAKLNEVCLYPKSNTLKATPFFSPKDVNRGEIFQCTVEGRKDRVRLS